MLNIPNLTLNKECNRIMQKYLEIMVLNLINNLGKSNIQSIILTGSLARGEGTARIKNSNIEIYSDIDLNLITNFLNLIKYNKSLKFLSKNYTEFLRTKGLLTHVNIIPITELELQNKTTIRRVECANSDKVIWGKNILSNKNYTPKLINKLDAIELLFNRIIDLLKIRSIENINLKIYLFTKVILDLNTSLLAFLGDYTASYLDRMKLINQAKYLSWIPNGKFPKLIQIFSKFKINCDFDTLASEFADLFQLNISDPSQLIHNLNKISSLYLAEILKKELCYLFSYHNCTEIDDLLLLKRYQKSNSNFFRNLMLKLNILLVNHINIKNYYKILLLKFHPKFYFHYILYCLLKSKYGALKIKKRYLTEAYNRIKDTIDISSIRNWNSIIKLFLKSQEIVLQRFLQ